MNIYDSDNLDRGNYDDLGQQHYHESLDWSDNLFGESIPGDDSADDMAADAAAADESTVDEDLSVADEDTEGGTEGAEDDEDEEEEDDDEDEA